MRDVTIGHFHRKKVLRLLFVLFIFRKFPTAIAVTRFDAQISEKAVAARLLPALGFGVKMPKQKSTSRCTLIDSPYPSHKPPHARTCVCVLACVVACAHQF